MSNGRGKKKKKNQMKRTVNQEIVFSAEEVFSMMEDTSQIVAQENSTRLSAMGPAASESGTLTDSVEFWSWMNRNYEKSGHFASSESMRSYMSGTQGQQNWAKKVVQGKGYEWDWMSAQRRSFKNLFKTFDAGDVANRPGSDITIHDFLTGTDTEQQLKAYTSKNTPHLKNTPKNMTVVTNAEKVEAVKNMGYEDIVSFGDNESIQAARDSRLDDMASGKATPNYNIKNVSSTAAKAGVVGFAISAGVETIASYKKWKSGKMSTWDYIKEIMKSGGNAGMTSTFSAGIMIPVTATITMAGVSNLVTIPISFVVSTTVDKVVAPAFARGDYKKILNEANYYTSLTEFCSSLSYTMEKASAQYIGFVGQMVSQQQKFSALAGNVISQQAIDDFEYYASLSAEEVGVVISGMVSLLNDTDSKFDSLKDQNWFQRMLRTVMGKNKATKEDIHRNYEKLGVYVSKAVEVLYQRQCVDEKIIQIQGEEIIALCRFNIALNVKVNTLMSRVDNITDSLLLVTKPNAEDQITSVKEIVDEAALKKYQEAEKLFVSGKLIDAFPVFKDAADNGVARAYYYMGEYYAEGYGHIAENSSNALEFWKKGMMLGDVLCTYKYGCLKYDKNEQMYCKWMLEHIHSVLRLVKENDSAALYEYGWHLITKNPGDVDALVDSLGYFKKAAKNRYWPGAHIFFQLTEDLRLTGMALPDYSPMLSKVEWYQSQLLLGYSKMLYDTSAYKECAKHFQKSLWLRDDAIEAAGMLAFVLNTGLVEDSLSDGYSKANIPMYFEAGLRSKNAFSLYQLGVLYFNGVGEKAVGRDMEKSYTCFEASYNLQKQGFVAGQLGYMNLLGEGTKEDNDKAIRYLDEGHELMDPGSMHLLAQCYENGWGVPKDNAKSERLMTEAAELSIPDQVNIIQTYTNAMIDDMKKERGSYAIIFNDSQYQ